MNKTATEVMMEKESRSIILEKIKSEMERALIYGRSSIHYDWQSYLEILKTANNKSKINQNKLKNLLKTI